MDVSEWLWKLGLDKYAPAFRENKITSDLRPSLTAEGNLVSAWSATAGAC
jgi:hypothetical protein